MIIVRLPYSITLLSSYISFFYIGFRSQAGGVLPYIFPPTRLPQYLVMFGTFAFIVTCFLISDGLANEGITDPVALGQMAAAATDHNFAVSTVGVGLSDPAAQVVDCAGLVVAPGFMGMLNKHLNGHLGHLVTDRFEKDYTKASDKELAGHLENCIFL